MFHTAGITAQPWETSAYSSHSFCSWFFSAHLHHPPGSCWRLIPGPDSRQPPWHSHPSLESLPIPGAHAFLTSRHLDAAFSSNFLRNKGKGIIFLANVQVWKCPFSIKEQDISYSWEFWCCSGVSHKAWNIPLNVFMTFSSFLVIWNSTTLCFGGCFYFPHSDG